MGNNTNNVICTNAAGATSAAYRDILFLLRFGSRIRALRVLKIKYATSYNDDILTTSQEDKQVFEVNWSGRPSG